MTDQRPQRILIVEDHPDSSAILQRLLQRCGFEVSAAATVAEALRLAGEENALPFQLLISDLGLPDGTGYELMQKLRAQYSLPGIALSGYSQIEDVRRALEAGFSRHLTKPIDFEILKVAIDELLDQSITAS